MNNPKINGFKIGQKATVKETGQQGVITAQSKDTNDRVQYALDNDETVWYDVPQLEIEEPDTKKDQGE